MAELAGQPPAAATLPHTLTLVHKVSLKACRTLVWVCGFGASTDSPAMTPAPCSTVTVCRAGDQPAYRVYVHGLWCQLLHYHLACEVSGHGHRGVVHPLHCHVVL